MSFSWRHPPRYVVATTIISMGGILFGLDTGTIGPLTLMDQFTNSFGQLSSTIHGLVVSTILIPAAASSLFGGHLANSVGRLKGVAIGAAVFGLGAAIEGSSVVLGMLFVGRVIKGLGEGLFLSNSVVYITEISPPSLRGTLASVPQLLTTLGLAAGYFICYGSVEIPSSFSWRLPFLVQAVIAFTFTICVLLFLPESPRWLTAVGRRIESLESWEKLGIPVADREKIEDSDGDVIPAGNIKDIFAVFGKHAWRRTTLGAFMMGMQQASGIDGVLYYAPLLFASAGLSSSTASFLASGITAILIVLVTFLGTIYADKWGRRTSTVVGGLLQSIPMLTIGALYASNSVHATHGTGRWVVIVCIYLFTLAFNGTWAVTFRPYVSEIQGPETRAGAASLSLSANWTVNWVVAFTTPIFLAKSSSGVYFLFGACALITSAVCVFWMPETRGRTLEDIDAEFRKRRGGLDVEITGDGGDVIDIDGLRYDGEEEKDLGGVTTTETPEQVGKSKDEGSS